jgi:tyrosyl-tRNA synthetase
VLATEVTALLHGRQAAGTAAEAARRTFEDGAATEALPQVSIPAGEVAEGVPAFRLFVLAGLVASNAEARRLVRGGGARLDDAPVTDEGQVVSAAALRAGVKLSVGRKHHRMVRLTPA